MLKVHWFNSLKTVQYRRTVSIYKFIRVLNCVLKVFFSVRDSFVQFVRNLKLFKTDGQFKYTNLLGYWEVKAYE